MEKAPLSYKVSDYVLVKKAKIISEVIGMHRIYIHKIEHISLWTKDPKI